MSEQPVRTTLAERVQQWADGDRIERILNEIESLETQIRVDVTCKHCGKRQNALASVPDNVRKLEALLKVIEQTEGKPGTVDGEPGGTTIIVERIWPGGVSGNGSSPGDVPAARTAEDLPRIEGEG